MSTSRIVRPLLLAALALGVAAPYAQAQTEDTLLWIGLRGGVGYFNDIDPDPLERLATELSSRRVPANSGYEPVEFVDKEWAFPFDVRLGLKLSDSINAWAFYERLPYFLENDFATRSGPTIPPDTDTLNIPANVFGGGFDFRLGSEGYGRSILLGFGIGRFWARGDDEDVQGYQNYEITGSGRFWEVQAMAEIDFTTEMSFYPFIAFRAAKTDETDVSVFALPDRPLPPAVDLDTGEVNAPPFEIDYTGVTIGLSVRFRVYPFDIIGDPDRGDDD